MEKSRGVIQAINQDPLMNQIEIELQQMLDQLAKESPVWEN